jgi:hypothetical protein
VSDTAQVELKSERVSAPVCGQLVERKVKDESEWQGLKVVHFSAQRKHILLVTTRYDPLYFKKPGGKSH